MLTTCKASQNGIIGLKSITVSIIALGDRKRRLLATSDMAPADLLNLASYFIARPKKMLLNGPTSITTLSYTTEITCVEASSYVCHLPGVVGLQQQITWP
jgi:hypothetical protein